MALPHEDALHGAAFHVLFERYYPDYCGNREMLKDLRDNLAKVKVWADTQSADVKAAYLRAAIDIEKRAEARVENNERSVQLAAVRKAIPVPPEE